MHCELNSFQSVRDFVDELNEFKADKPVDRLICNAAVYQPSLPYAKWSVDGTVTASALRLRPLPPPSVTLIRLRERRP